MKLLLADDEVFIRESLSIFFEDEGFEVITAEDGEICVEKFKSEEPDIVLLDLRMPHPPAAE